MRKDSLETSTTQVEDAIRGGSVKRVPLTTSELLSVVVRRSVVAILIRRQQTRKTCACTSGRGQAGAGAARGEGRQEEEEGFIRCRDSWP